MYRQKILALIAVLFALGGLYFSYVFYRVFFQPNTRFTTSTAYVFIASDAGIDEVITDLAPLLKSPDDFRLAANKKGYSTRIRPGKYAVKKGMNNNELVNTLRARPLTVKVTFNNIERLENLAARVAQQLEVDSLSLIETLRNPDFLKVHDFTAETALAMYIPNTYDFFWSGSAANFQDRMWKEYQRFWSSKRTAAAEALGLSPVEVITLASIVHKETNRIDERPLVAGVYLNRLKRGMRLDADPTVIYAMKKNENNFDLQVRRVLKKDLRLQSPYNTYRVKGLPPGPITMPDISAIDAVLFPAQHDFLFFVVDPSQNGRHDFSLTLREHTRKARKYYRWLNKQRLYR